MLIEALVYLFLLKIRYPSNQIIANITSLRYGLCIPYLFRKDERKTKKYHKVNEYLHFLSCCKVYCRFPKCLCFKFYRESHCSSYLYRDMQTKLLDQEIKIKTRQKERAVSVESAAFEGLCSVISRSDRTVVLNT